MSEIRMTYVGNVTVVNDASCRRKQLEKISEELSEVIEAWEEWVDCDIDDARLRKRIAEECADLITATCGLLNALGVSDMTEEMTACRERNRKRGRIGRDAEC